jgi:hypothetical protein
LNYEYQYLSKYGRIGPFKKTTYLGRKVFIFSNYSFRFGFRVSFYLSPELDLLKYAQDQKIWSQFQTFVNPDQCAIVNSTKNRNNYA